MFGQPLEGDANYKGLLLVLPLLTGGHVVNAFPEEREAWFDLFSAKTWAVAQLPTVAFSDALPHSRSFIMTQDAFLNVSRVRYSGYAGPHLRHLRFA